MVAPKTPLSINPNRAYVSPYNTSAPNYQLQYRATERTPFPIINQNEKKFFDKILDFLIGDGQSSLYGMVCKECYGHNGTITTLFTVLINNFLTALVNRIKCVNRVGGKIEHRHERRNNIDLTF